MINSPRSVGLFNWLKWTIQRGLRGYADCDVWNMSDYLVAVILPMLKELQKDKGGYPCNHYYKSSCNCEENWDKALEEMIEGFEAAKRVWDDGYPVSSYLKESRKDEKMFRKGMRVFAKYFFALWS